MLNVPLLWQSLPADCLPTCAEMILRYYGFQFGRDALRRLLGFAQYGTPSSNITSLRSAGFQVTFGTAKDDVPLRTSLARGIPPICFIQTGALQHWSYSTGHAVVVVDATETHVVVNDPAFAERPISLPFDEFMLAWSDRDMEYALVWSD